jgi:lysophospholipase L1-like esterase
MWRAFPWVLSAVLLIAFGASFSELQRVRKRFGEVTRHTFHDHQDVRRFIIRSEIVQTKRPIVVFGDSITEMAPLPREIAGYRVINAGIGAIRTYEFSSIAPKLLEGSAPAAIAIALGANDAGSTQESRDLSSLVALLKNWSSRIVVVSVTSDPSINDQIREAAQFQKVPFYEVQIDDALKMPDRIHYTHKAYDRWVPSLQRALETAISDD